MITTRGNNLLEDLNKLTGNVYIPSLKA